MPGSVQVCLDLVDQLIVPISFRARCSPRDLILTMPDSEVLFYIILSCLSGA